MEFWGTTIALWVKLHDARIKILLTLSTCPLRLAASKNTSSLWYSHPDNALDTFAGWCYGIAAWLLCPQPKYTGFNAQKINSPTIMNIYTRGGRYLFPSRGGGGYSDFGDSTITFYIYIMNQSCGRVGREQSHIHKVWIHYFFFLWWNSWFPFSGMGTRSPGNLGWNQPTVMSSRLRCWCKAMRQLLLTSPQHSGDLRLEIKSWWLDEEEPHKSPF